MSYRGLTKLCYRCAPSIDLVLLSHGDLAHSGLYPYAYARWGLKAPAYTTLPVQATGRIAATEDVERIREEEDVGDDSTLHEDGIEDAEDQFLSGTPMEDTAVEVEFDAASKKSKTGKYVATVQEVHDAFDSVNTLRFTQPCHLQGTFALTLFSNRLF